MEHTVRYYGAILVMALALAMQSALGDSRLLATGGATQLEGAGGSGIVPWAVISGYGSTGETSILGATTYIDTGDYQLNVFSAAFSYNNRLELSLTRQELDLDTLGPQIGEPGAELRQDVIGAKVRLLGDVIYTPYPQVSAGVQYKHNREFDIPHSVGARDDSGFDFYISAAKVWLAAVADRNVLLNGTVRATRANQIGLLGFGSDADNNYDYVFEGSTALFLTRRIVVGYDYRQKPDNLGFAEENDWHDLFVGWFPNKHLSVVAAYARLGSIATLDNQDGFYASLEVGF